MTEETRILEDYELSVHILAKHFLAKHYPDTEYSVDLWVNRKVGDAIIVEYLSISFDEMVTDLRFKTPVGKYKEFRRDKDLYFTNGGTINMNYETYLRGLSFDELKK